MRKPVGLGVGVVGSGVVIRRKSSVLSPSPSSGSSGVAMGDVGGCGVGVTYGVTVGRGVGNSSLPGAGVALAPGGCEITTQRIIAVIGVDGVHPVTLADEDVDVAFVGRVVGEPAVEVAQRDVVIGGDVVDFAGAAVESHSWVDAGIEFAGFAGELQPRLDANFVRSHCRRRRQPTARS